MADIFVYDDKQIQIPRSSQKLLQRLYMRLGGVLRVIRELKVLRRLLTAGAGSCLIHALFGFFWQKKIVFSPDFLVIREELIRFLSFFQNTKEMHPELATHVRNLLTNYYNGGVPEYTPLPRINKLYAETRTKIDQRIGQIKLLKHQLFLVFQTILSFAVSSKVAEFMSLVLNHREKGTLSALARQLRSVCCVADDFDVNSSTFRATSIINAIEELKQRKDFESYFINHLDVIAHLFPDLRDAVEYVQLQQVTAADWLSDLLASDSVYEDYIRHLKHEFSSYWLFIDELYFLTQLGRMKVKVLVENQIQCVATYNVEWFRNQVTGKTFTPIQLFCRYYGNEIFIQGNGQHFSLLKEIYPKAESQEASQVPNCLVPDSCIEALMLLDTLHSQMRSNRKVGSIVNKIRPENVWPKILKACDCHFRSILPKDIVSERSRAAQLEQSARNNLILSELRCFLVKSESNISFHRRYQGLQCCKQCYATVRAVSLRTLERLESLIRSKFHENAMESPKWEHGRKRICSGVRVSQATFECLRWMEQNFGLLGERMPDREVSVLPPGYKVEYYDKFRTETKVDLSLPYFYYLWRYNFRDVKTCLSQRMSKCGICEEYSALLLTGDSEQIAKARTPYNEHLQFVKGERGIYYHHQELAQDSPHEVLSLIVDSMDQIKTALPSGYDSDVTLRIRVVAGLSHGPKNRAFAFFINEKFAAGSNTTINTLWQIFKGIGFDNVPRKLYLQLDNTVKENKNNHVMRFLCFLVLIGMFTHVYINFLPVGHTHEVTSFLFLFSLCIIPYSFISLFSYFLFLYSFISRKKSGREPSKK